MKFNYKTVFTSVLLASFIVGCGGDSNSTPVDSNRFVKMTMSDQNIMQDTKTNLEWVEGNNLPNVASGCNPQPAGKTEVEIKNIAEQFCQDLTFASHDDWRMATASEHKEFITAMSTAGKTPFYANPTCPRLVSEESNGTIQTVNTHNTAPTGEIKPWIDLNAGIKCVRTLTVMP